MPERDPARIRAALEARIGGDRVHYDTATLERHRHDTWMLALWRAMRGRLGAPPACVVTPASAAEVSAVLRYANEARVPVVPFGGGSGVCGGILPSPGAIVLDLQRLDALVAVNERALLAVVQAGMNGGACERELNAKGYSLGHYPQSIDVSTVGGWVATRAAGQFSTRYGSIEDRVVGLEVVLADGRILRIKPVPRRATGPDLRALFLGAEGTLGVVTEVTLRILPLPEARILRACAFRSFDDGLEALRRILRAGWRPPVLRLYDAEESRRHFGTWAAAGEALLLVLTEGPAELAAAEAAGCQRICEAQGARDVGPEPVEHWLAERNHVPGFEPFLAQGYVLDTIEVAATWDRIGDLYRAVMDALREVPELVVASGHSSHGYPEGTNIYFTFVARPADPEAGERVYLECWARAMAATLRSGGTIAHHHGVGRVRRPWMGAELGVGLDVLRALKAALDPNGIMNPGVLLPAEGRG